MMSTKGFSQYSDTPSSWGGVGSTENGSESLKVEMTVEMYRTPKKMVEERGVEVSTIPLGGFE